MMNEFCNLYSYITYFYYGLFKSFSQKSKGGMQQNQNENQYEDEIKMKDTIIPKIRENIRVSIRQSIRDENSIASDLVSNRQT